jgi:hypothetical protein
MGSLAFWGGVGGFAEGANEATRVRIDRENMTLDEARQNRLLVLGNKLQKERDAEQNKVMGAESQKERDFRSEEAEKASRTASQQAGYERTASMVQSRDQTSAMREEAELGRKHDTKLFERGQTADYWKTMTNNEAAMELEIERGNRYERIALIGAGSAMQASSKWKVTNIKNEVLSAAGFESSEEIWITQDGVGTFKQDGDKFFPQHEGSREDYMTDADGNPRPEPNAKNITDLLLHPERVGSFIRTFGYLPYDFVALMVYNRPAPGAVSGMGTPAEKLEGTFGTKAMDPVLGQPAQ